MEKNCGNGVTGYCIRVQNSKRLNIEILEDGIPDLRLVLRMKKVS